MFCSKSHTFPLANLSGLQSQAATAFARVTNNVALKSSFGIVSVFASLMFGTNISYCQTSHTGSLPPTPVQKMEQRKVELLNQCPEIKTPTTSALPIHITKWGTEGPLVLLIHGGVQGNLGGGPNTFVGQKPLSQIGWRVELADRPGFGESPSRGADDMEADSVWIADTLGAGGNLIGHSFGGGEALLAAARRPGAVRSLVLVEPALQPMLSTEPHLFADPVLRDSAMKMVADVTTAQTPGQLAISFASGLGTDGHGSLNRAAIALQEHPEAAATVGCALLRARAASPQQLRTAADAVVEAGIPVLVITGGYDPGTDAAGEAFAKILHGTHTIVPSPNHFVQEANPKEFNRVVDEFMRKAGNAPPNRH